MAEELSKKSKIKLTAGEIQKRTKQLNLCLREKYLQFLEKEPQTYCKPQGGEAVNSIGPWPEFIFHGLACNYNKKGFCTPCGYSNIPPVLEDDSQAYEALLAQTEHIVGNPIEHILDAQRRAEPYPNFPKRFKEGKNAMMALSPIGSFFNGRELPLVIRIKILQKVADVVQEHKLNFQLFIEVHADDVIEANKKDEIQPVLHLLKELNTVVLIGLESIDQVVREILFFKDLRLFNFETAVDILRKHELEVGAFIFAGVHSMTEKETIQDVKSSLKYLSDRNVVPVVMLANLQKYTLNHLLYVHGRYRMLDPWSILELICMLRTYSAGPETTDPWFFADPEGGPPSPVAAPFQNDKKIACGLCSNRILNIIRRLREDYDWERFDLGQMALKDCACRNEYREFLKEQAETEGKIDLLDRAYENIMFADSAKNHYTSSLSRK